MKIRILIIYFIIILFGCKTVKANEDSANIVDSIDKPKEEIEYFEYYSYIYDKVTRYKELLDEFQQGWAHNTVVNTRLQRDFGSVPEVRLFTARYDTVLSYISVLNIEASASISTYILTFLLYKDYGENNSLIENNDHLNQLIGVAEQKWVNFLSVLDHYEQLTTECDYILQKYYK